MKLFEDAILKVVDKHAPLVKIRAKKDKADSIVNEVPQLLTRRVQKTPFQEHWNRHKELRAEVNRRMRQAKANHFSAVY